MHSIQNEAGKRSAENAGERQTGKEQRDGLSLFALAKPVGEIEDDAGKVAGFREAEQKTQDVQLGDAVNEAGEKRQAAPSDDDAGEPDASTELMEQQVAGNLENEISEEENSGEKAELLAGDAEILVHGER